ncbi:MAG TPA: tRNA pseudouridine(38-40) synthase TruA [Methylomirabilota bacterium]|nr:tRNA pseudouridine(38-40) synthase TruA [Methylomirabilota bacterium]
MPRYKLLVEYDGTGYRGWQRQAASAGDSVQGVLETAIAAFAGHPVTLFGAGRTDAGVHASGQVAHVDLAKGLPGGTVRDAANAHIRPHPVTVVDAEAVGDDFDARFSAKRRHYLYRIFDRRPPPAIGRDYVWHVPRRLDVEAMHAAAQRLVGHHDFTTFRSVDCQSKSPVKTLDRIAVIRVGAEVHVEVTARSFLHNQVRSMVGSLRRVGDGSWTADDLADALEARDRAACGPVAVAAGLCLVRVDY